MLYNNDKERICTNIDCLTCTYFNAENKKCNGIGKKCFEYDKYTMTVIDAITHLPINLNKLKELREQEKE